jgi:hypothetical protein
MSEREREREREIKTLSKYQCILIANNWLQLGWRPPCEVSKNLVVPVAFTIGLWSHLACATDPLQTCNQPGCLLKKTEITERNYCSYEELIL